MGMACRVPDLLSTLLRLAESSQMLSGERHKDQFLWLDCLLRSQQRLRCDYCRAPHLLACSEALWQDVWERTPSSGSPAHAGA